MGRFIGWDDVVSRYSVARSASAGAKDMDEQHIKPAEREVEGRLAAAFGVPFSSTNETAKDLSIDATFLRLAVFKSKKEREAAVAAFDARIKRLLAGAEAMIVSSSNDFVTPIYASVGDPWSNTKDYQPTFRQTGDFIDYVVDSQQTIDEESDRGIFY